MPEQLRVLMVAPTPFFSDRGCHVRIYEEARALRAAGHEVLVATYHLGRDLEIPTVRIPMVPWYRKLAPGPSWHKPYLDLLLLVKALGVGRRFRPHLIHAHLHEGAFIGMFLKRLLGVPLLLDSQGSLITEIVDHGFVRKGGAAWRLFRGIEGIVNRAADAIVTSSTAGAADLVSGWALTAERVTPVVDGVDTGVFRPLSREEARRRLGLPPQGPVAVFLGVLNRYQGVDILLETARLLRERRSPARFVVMGFPEERYREQAEQMGLADTVTFTGRIDYAEAPALLAAADIALSPKISLTEANGKLFNYMACGLPTVCFDTPVNREILGETGIYVALGDATAYAAAVDAALNDPRREELAEAVRRRAVDRHSWEARREVLLAVYRRLLAAPPTAPAHGRGQ